MRIAQAAALTGLSPRQIRYHSERGVLAPGQRVRGRHREFTDGDIQRLTMLRSLLAAGIAPPVAARAVDGRLTAAEQQQVDDRLARQAAGTQQTRAVLAGRRRPDPAGQPDISLMFDIFVLRTRMGTALTAVLAEASLTATEYALLSLIDETRSRTTTELAQLVGVAPAALGRQLTELVRRGWIIRSAEPGRRRRTVLALTPDGDRRFRAAIPHAARLAAELDGGLRRGGTEPEEARALLQTISAVLGALGVRSPHGNRDGDRAPTE